MEEAAVSHNRIRPGTVNIVCTYTRHEDNRGTAATMRWVDGQLVPLWGVRVYPYESGIDTWAVTCRCGQTAQMSQPRWCEHAQVPAGLTRVDLDIMNLIR